MRKIRSILAGLMCLAIFAAVFTFSPSRQAQAVESEVTVEEIKSALSGYTIMLTVNNQEQRFEVKEKEISRVTVKSQKLSSDGKSLTVKAVVLVDRKVATVKTTATIKFKLKNDAWKESGVTFKTPTISKIPVKGTWKGTYTAGQGETTVKFKVSKVTKDGYITDGTMFFGSTPTNKVPDGSYSITGGYDTALGKIAFFGEEWIEKPGSTWGMIDFTCYVDLVNECVTGNNSLKITR